ETELFGLTDGARREGAAGKIAQAQGGRLFLGEIGDMPLELQARLLHVLQERRGPPRGPGPVDVAIITATHRNLREMVERHEFREDLYYRLNGLSVRLPALRERVDLMAIVQRILRAECDGRLPEPATLEELERQTILRVVKELDGNISLASKRLGISRNTIYRKLRRA